MLLLTLTGPPPAGHAWPALGALAASSCSPADEAPCNLESLCAAGALLALLRAFPAAATTWQPAFAHALRASGWLGPAQRAQGAQWLGAAAEAQAPAGAQPPAASLLLSLLLARWLLGLATHRTSAQELRELFALLAAQPGEGGEAAAARRQTLVMLLRCMLGAQSGHATWPVQRPAANYVPGLPRVSLS